MVNLTAAQIQAILEAAVYPEPIQVNGALLQNESRRKYPSIDVQNVTGDEQLKNFPTTTLGQTFLVHLFYRYRSFGEQEEPAIKAIEDVIFTTLDTNSNFSIDVKVSVTQSWERRSETFPTRRSHSILRVIAEEISSTESTGTPGDQIEITFPSLGTVKVVSMPADLWETVKSLDLEDDGNEIYTKIHSHGLNTVDLELSPAQELTMQALITAGSDITVTIDKNGTTRDMLVNLSSMLSSAVRSEVQTTAVTMDVIDWT